MDIVHIFNREFINVVDRISQLIYLDAIYKWPEILPNLVHYFSELIYLDVISKWSETPPKFFLYHISQLIYPDKISR